jgi:crotonobetainyl-CoA:carnitine CoA-transferase CaiB-like acyl-CoA transferase
VGSMSFPSYLVAMRRPDLADDPRFLTPELRLKHLNELRAIVQDWILTFSDMDSLDVHMDEAKIATGRVRDIKEFADTDWAYEWKAVRSVSDRSGGVINIPGRPWHFSDHSASDTSEEQFVSKQGEHNDEILTELGYSPDTIAELVARGGLVQPGRSVEPESAQIIESVS